MEVSFIQEVSGVNASPFLDIDDLKMALRARKLSGAFEKWAPGQCGSKTDCVRDWEKIEAFFNL